MVSLRILYGSFRKHLRRADIDLLARDWANDLLQIVKLSYTVNKIDPSAYVADRCIILMSNHGSLYDIPLIISALPGSIRMLAKRELFRVPIWGAAMRAAEFVSIDRKNRQQAMRDLQIAGEKMHSGIVLWIAPEGTRSRSGELLSFKKGGFILAIQAGAIIVPVGIRGADKVLPADSLQFNIGEHVDINIGAPIDAADYKLENKNLLMQRVAEQLSALTKA